LVWLMIQLLFQNSSFSFSFLDYVVDDNDVEGALRTSSADSGTQRRNSL
jgi:hypothetical protein